MRNRILYWDGIIDLKGLSGEYHKVIQMLLAGEYRLLSLEKLHGHDVYSVRINDTHRMLFKTEEVDDRPMLVILDIVLNHDYHKSPFLKPTVLRNYLELNGQAFAEAAIRNEDFEAVKQPRIVCESANAEEYEFVPAEYYKQRFIEFNDVQQQIVHVAKLPLVINGAAGSGKSCVALSLLSHYVLNHIAVETKPIIYVTQSEKLCNSMYRNWMSLPIAYHPDATMVVFKTYQQLISEYFPAGYHPKQISRDEFVIYMQERLKTKAVRKATQSFSDAFIKQVALMYQEMRIISGCRDLAHYNRLGKNQSLLKDKTERAWLFKEYNTYLNYLKHNNLIDFAFYTPEVKNIFDLVVVDETQDLSNLQIATLYGMAANRQICFCEDMRQSLTDKLPKIYADILNAEENEVTFIQLQQSYRCSQTVLRMANEVSQLAARLLKQHFVPTINDQSNRDGSVVWHDVLTAEDEHTYLTQAQTPDFAVITCKEYCDKARARFKTDLVFTIDEIKGLEYRNILVYRLMDADIYYEISQLISKGIIARPGNEKYCPALNALYTAFTRSIESLVIVEDQLEACHKLQHLVAYLKQGLSAQVLQVKPVKTHSEEEKREMWFKEARRLVETGDRPRAQKIYVSKLGLSEDVFERDYPAAHSVSSSDELVKPATSTAVKLEARLQPPASEITAPRHVEFNIADILANPTKAKLEMLFNSKKATVLLFDYTDDQEPLLAKLFDQLNCRAIILEFGIFARAYPKIAASFNEKAVNKSIFWIACHTETMKKVSGNPLFRETILKLVSPEIMLRMMRVPKTLIDDFSLMFQLSYTPWGIGVLCEYFERRSEALFQITKTHMFHPLTTWSLFQNLIVDEKGLDLYAKVLAINPGFNYLIELTNLLMLDSTKKHIILNLVLSRPKGRRFIQELQTKIPSFYDKDLSKLNKSQVKDLVVEIAGTTEERDYLTRYMKNLSTASLQDILVIFSHNNPVKLLFKMHAYSDQCLFSHLFEYSDARRRLLSTIIPTYMGMINANIKPKMLVRSSTNEFMPPAFWLAGSESGCQMLAHWLTGGNGSDIEIEPLLREKNISDYVRNANLPDEFNPFKNKDYIPAIFKGNVVSTLLLMLLSISGRSTILILVSKTNLLKHLPNFYFQNKWITDVATKNVISPLLYLSRQEHGCLLLTTILLRQKNNRLITTDALLDGIEIKDGNKLVGECVLVNILNKDNDSEFLLTILEDHVKFDMERIMPILLFSLLPGSDEGDWLKKLFKGEQYTAKILAILQQKPHLIKMLDKRILLGDFGKTPFYKQYLFDALNETQTGKQLLTLMQDGLREPYSPGLFVTKEEEAVAEECAVTNHRGL